MNTNDAFSTFLTLLAALTTEAEIKTYVRSHLTSKELLARFEELTANEVSLQTLITVGAGLLVRQQMLDEKIARCSRPTMKLPPPFFGNDEPTGRHSPVALRAAAIIASILSMLFFVSGCSAPVASSSAVVPCCSLLDEMTKSCESPVIAAGTPFEMCESDAGSDAAPLYTDCVGTPSSAGGERCTYTPPSTPAPRCCETNGYGGEEVFCQGPGLIVGLGDGNSCNVVPEDGGATLTGVNPLYVCAEADGSYRLPGPGVGCVGVDGGSFAEPAVQTFVYPTYDAGSPNCQFVPNAAWGPDGSSGTLYCQNADGSWSVVE